MIDSLYPRYYLDVDEGEGGGGGGDPASGGDDPEGGGETDAPLDPVAAITQDTEYADLFVNQEDAQVTS